MGKIIVTQPMEKEKKRPLILISNDDGYHSGGLRYLCEFLKDMAEIIVCAPEAARSGFACAFSAVPPLYLKRRKDIAGAEVWSCTGTPVDCVKLALDQLLDGRTPDLIIGGINHGDNSTVNTHYSGTMGVAMEGCMKYIPSIAFSSCDYNPEANLSHLRSYVRMFVKRVLNEGMPKGICLNINFPRREEFAGIKVCRMSFGRWVNEVVKERHPHGYDFYWMVGQYQNDEPEATDTDRWALANGYISVTPTQMDVTAYSVMERMAQEWNAEE